MNKTEILAEIEKVYGKVCKVFDFDYINHPEIKFTLRGKCAGQFCFYHYDKKTELNFNLPMAKLNGDAYKKTIVHEIAHHVTKELYSHKVKPHGKEWKNVMVRLGAEPKRTHSYQMPETVKARSPYVYICNCKEHYVSKILHNKMCRGKKYICKSCKSNLEYVETIKF